MSSSVIVILLLTLTHYHTCNFQYSHCCLQIPCLLHGLSVAVKDQ